jgi:transglycosylase-like protein
MFAPSPKLTVLAVAGTLAAAAGVQAAAAPSTAAKRGEARTPKVAILERPDDRFDRSVVVDRYRTAYSRARDAGVAPKDNLAEGRRASGDRLQRATPHLRSAVRAQTASTAPAAGAAGATAGSAESLGVSQSTLEAIASCESGDDPTAVSPDGTYRGKYQFTEATWESVGGSGDPAAAPEAEQDMRAAMLYSQVGASAWPVCGQ